MNNDIFSKYVNKDQEKIKQKGKRSFLAFLIIMEWNQFWHQFFTPISRDRYLYGIYIFLLTDSIFETGVDGVPSKSQNPTVLGQGGSIQTLARHAFFLLK